LPSEVDLSSLLSSARDQGSRGTCTAFAVTALHEAQKHNLALSEEVLYWGAKQADKNYNSGTSFRSAHLALRKWGQPETHLWPYDPARSDGDASYHPPAEAIDPANCYFARLASVTLDIPTIKTHLAAGRLVAASVQMSLDFYSPRNGRIDVPDAHQLISDNHAILLTGYLDTDLVFRFRNSWGQSWGVDGYGELPYEYLTRHGKAVCTLVSVV